MFFTFSKDAPCLTLLKKIQDNWDGISKSKYKVLKPLKIDTKNERRKSLIEFYKSIISSQVRDDYREAAELALMLLGADQKFGFRKPAGDSNARWLAKFLYAAKNYMLVKHERAFARKLEQFLIFCVYVYLPAWYQAPFIQEAVVSDLQLARDLEW